MSHIVIDARIINSSTGRYVERLVHFLEEIDHKNRYTILVPPKDKNFWVPTSSNFTVKTVPFKNYSLGEQFLFNLYLYTLRPDLVHFCMPQQPMAYIGRRVTTFHDLTLLNTYNSDKNWFTFHFKQFIGRFVFKSVARSNSHIVTPSDYTKQELIKFANISPSKVTVTYESGEIDKIQPKSYRQPFKQYLLYVGQQSDYKNLKRLGDAHQLLLAKYPGLGLILVGKKNASALKNEAYFHKQGYKNIIFTDYVDDPSLAWIMTHASAYVFPSLMEGFGLPPLEAMASGIPVVSSSASCMPEVIGKAAHYFDPLDINDMSQAIDEVLSSEQLRRQLVKSGFQQIKKYSWVKMARETLAVYNKALGGKS